MQKYFAMQGILLCKNWVINRVLKWFVGLIDLQQHTTGDKQAIWALENLLATQAFDCIASAQG